MKVMDSFTLEFLADARVEVLSSDSVLLYEIKTKPKEEIVRGRVVNGVVLLKDIKMRDLIFRFSKEGYESQYVNYKLRGKREAYWLLPNVLLKRKEKQIGLKEVVVKASKVRMVIKGDTIEYNADAFMLSNGSMLDALIKQLPGVEIQGGRISVNGRFVSSLLVNGDDFFKGDARIALENLPAYMVQKVQVYEKEPEYAYITGRDSTIENPMVMNVQLKKQYSIGWLANASAGGGTEDRWLTRLFGLRFTPNSRFAAYSSANNISDFREPGIQGNWTPYGSESGETHSINGGIDYILSDKNKKWKLNSNIKLIRTESKNHTEISGERYLFGGNTWTRSRNMSNNRNLTIKSGHTFHYAGEVIFFDIKPNIEYSYSKNRSSMRSAELSEKPEEQYRVEVIDSLFSLPPKQQWQRAVINTRADERMGNGKQFQAGTSFTSYINIPHSPDYANVNANINFLDYTSERFLQTTLWNPALKNTDYQNKYFDAPRREYNLSVDMKYAYRPDWCRISPSYAVMHAYKRSRSNIYLLDALDGFGIDNAPQLGLLPTTSLLSKILDEANSSFSILQNTKHIISPEWMIYINGGKQHITITPSVRISRDHLQFSQNTLDTIVQRTMVFFEPRIRYGFDGFGLSYSYHAAEPELVSMLNIKNDSDPLLQFQGNSNLKTPWQHNVNFNRGYYNNKKNQSLQFYANYSLISKQIVEALFYDRQTGIRTIIPQNINGNWSADFSVAGTTPLGVKRRSIFSTNTKISYVNAVDYVYETREINTGKNSVRNIYVSENMKVNIPFKQTQLALVTNVSYRHARSEHSYLSKINCFDYHFGANLQQQIGKNLMFSSDLTLYNRNGYNDDAMNTSDLVWNARLSQSLLGGSMIIALDGYDILRQLSNIRYTLNAQGRTEVWTNTVPGYIMATLTYRLNVKPKKR